MEFILIRGVFKFRGNILYSIMIINVLKLASGANNLSQGTYGYPLYVCLIVAALTFITALFIKSRAFPNLTYSGVRKSASNRFLFD